MPKKRWIPTYDITVKVSVPNVGDPRIAWERAHDALEDLRAALPPGAGYQIMRTGPGKVEAPATVIDTVNDVVEPAPTPVAEHRMEISPQANEVNGLAPETAPEEISPAQDMEIPPSLDRRVPRREAE